MHWFAADFQTVDPRGSLEGTKCPRLPATLPSNVFHRPLSISAVGRNNRV